ncbi:MAG: hypothetical protein LBC68_10305 [Prevotellaceae bacterium]|jgi:hypothetical protein|nr:hypothetical protein [Prevotellaceae bacterium]
MKKLSIKDAIRGAYFALSMAAVCSLEEAPVLVIILFGVNMGIAVWQVNKIKFNPKEKRV